MWLAVLVLAYVRGAIGIRVGALAALEQSGARVAISVLLGDLAVALASAVFLPVYFMRLQLVEVGHGQQALIEAADIGHPFCEL